MDLLDFTLFFVTASFAYRVIFPERRPDDKQAMATQQAKLEHDRVLLDMSSPLTMRGDNTQVAEKAPRRHQQHQQQERPMAGQKRKAQDSPNAEPPAKRRPAAKKTPMYDRILGCLELQHPEIDAAFDLNGGAQLVNTLEFLLRMYQTQTKKAIIPGDLNIILVQETEEGWLSLLSIPRYSLRVINDTKVLIKGDLMTTRETALCGLRNAVEKHAARC